MKSKSLLITGFEPFDGETLNPSQMILDWVSADPELSESCEVLLLPVSFQRAPQLALEKWRTGSFQSWIGFGQAGGRSKISLERVALNWKESSIPDNLGVHPEPGPLHKGQPSAYFSEGKLSQLKESLSFPTEVSFSAGAYVCNSLYFHMLEAFYSTTSSPGAKKSFFVHIPYLEIQVAGRNPPCPWISEKDLKRSALQILKGVLRGHPETE